MGNTASLNVNLSNEQDYLSLSFSGYNDSLVVSGIAGTKLMLLAYRTIILSVMSWKSYRRNMTRNI